MAHPIFPRQQTTRRSLLKSAVFGPVAAIAAPYVKDSYAAGSLALGVWDHWVPGANNAFAALCNEWGTKNNVEVRIDFITSQGEKDKLTAAAEAQAGTGHDIMSHRDRNIRVHAELLEPLDEIAAALIQQYGPISPVAEYLAKIKGAWRGLPAAWTPLTYGAVMTAAEPRAAVLRTARRDRRELPMLSSRMVISSFFSL